MAYRYSYILIGAVFHFVAEWRVDIIDRKILDILQLDASLPMAALAERVGLSQAPCWRRVKKLEEDGYIDRRVAILNRGKANVRVTVFVAIRTARHALDWLETFRLAISDIPEIVEAWRLTGRDDYLLRIVVPDIETYDAVYKKLIARVEFFDITSSIAMEEMKFTTAVPTGYIT
jgi:Lrp/AsnC family transcriptional regulator